MHHIRIAPEVQQDHANFSAITRIDGAGGVRHGDGVSQREPAARADLRFVARRQLDREPGGHQARHPGLERRVLDRAQIHAGVLVRSVGVGRQDGGGMHALDSDLHPRYHSVLPTKRVITVAPMPPEKSAYALARYSRSPDSIRDSIEWVRTHDSQTFLERFYFQYGHASIADLGHAVVCFEGISELAATEIEEEPLWDGQAKSSRYQDFSRGGFVTPPEFSAAEAEAYRSAAGDLLAAYAEVNGRAVEFLTARYPCPAEMKPDAYRRNLAARAFDVA